MQVKIYDDNQKEITVSDLKFEKIVINEKDFLFVKVTEDISMQDFESIRKHLIKSSSLLEKQMILVSKDIEIHKGEKIL